MSQTPSAAATPSRPHPSLRSLDPLVGTWAMSGPGLGGTVRYEWMDGGGFLVQHVDLVHDEETTRGVEHIGFDRASGTLTSHYLSEDGNILEYTYDLSGSRASAAAGS